MTTTTTTTKFTPKKIPLTDYQLFDGNWGGCIKCGEIAEIEPDARECLCESCGTKTVYGQIELLMWGLVDIIDE